LADRFGRRIPLMANVIYFRSSSCLRLCAESVFLFAIGWAENGALDFSDGSAILAEFSAEFERVFHLFFLLAHARFLCWL
jgi:hypothetical protein